MAFMDYGAILKIDGQFKNINKDLFMDMKEAVGFTVEPIPYQYEFGGETYKSSYVIDGNYFVYFGDEEVLFCIYKGFIQILLDKKEMRSLHFDVQDRKKVVKYYQVNGAQIKIKKIDEGRKFHAKVQYKGKNYEVIYGYGIDNDLGTFRQISRKNRYGYNKKITKYIENFLH